MNSTPHSSLNSPSRSSGAPLLAPRRIRLAFIAFFSSILLVSAVGLSVRFFKEKSTQVTLTNYSAFLPGKYRKEIQTTLYSVLKKSTDLSGFPTGEIREDSFVSLTDQGRTTVSFLVDLDTYRQTFLVSYSFSDSAPLTSPNTTANSILISCPSREKRKYSDSSCVGMYNTSASADALASVSNLAAALPIVVDDFNFTSRTAIHYEILGHLNGNNEYIITINDHSGGNRTAALEKLAALGVSEENYKILYYDLSRPGL